MEEHADKLRDSPEFLYICTLHTQMAWAIYVARRKLHIIYLQGRFWDPSELYIESENSHLQSTHSESISDFVPEGRVNRHCQAHR